MKLVSAVQPQLEYTYSATIGSSFGSTRSVISTGRLFRSEREFGVSRDTCEQIVSVVYIPIWFIKSVVILLRH